MSAIDTQRFGKYEVIEELGRGGMGVVYKARDPLIGRLVALKTLTADCAADPDLLRRFEREAQSAGRLQHPNIVTIYDIGNANGTPFIAMEFLEGESLEKIMARGEPIPLATKLDILLQFCRGLAYAHQRDVVHRDIKPANIFVTRDGTVKIVDFGVVHISDTSMTQTGMVIGTIPYMSPEQVSGQKVDPRSDIFSVGTVAYEFISGTKPFDGANMPAIMLKIVQDSVTPLSHLVPDVPPVLEQAVMRCLERDPDSRFQSLEDLVVELEPLEQGLKRQRIGEMVNRSQALYEQKEYTKARDVLRSVLVLDSGQTQAKTLMAKIVTEMRRQEVASRVEHLVGEGNSLLSQGKNAEAGRVLEEAVKLDSGHTHARVLLGEARSRAERERTVSEQIAAIQAALGKGQITTAETALSRLREVDATHHEAAVFEERIRQARAHELRLRLQQALSFPQHLLDEGRPEEAVQQLEELRKEFPNQAEVEQTLEKARRKLADAERRRDAEAAAAEIKKLVAEQNFAEASGRLDKLRDQLKQYPELADVHRSATQQFEAGVRAERLKRELAAIQELIRSENYQAAVERAQRLRTEMPENDEARRALEFARARLEQERVNQRVKQELDTIEKLLAVKDYSTALERSESLGKQYPDREDVRRLLEVTRSARRSAEKKQVDAYCQTIQAFLEAGEAQRAREEAEHALRYFPGNSDLTALRTTAQRAIDERAALRQTSVPAADISPQPPASPALRGGPPSADESATALFRPDAVRRVEQPVLPGGGTERRAPAVRPAAVTPAKEAESGATAHPSAFELLRGRPKLLLAGAAAAVVILVILVLALRRHPAAPPVSQAPVQVTVTTTPPGAAVRIDGQEQGVSPVNAKLSPGTDHQLVLTKEGYQDLSQAFQVHAGQALPPFVMQPLAAKLQLVTGDMNGVQIQWDGNPSGGATDGKWELGDVAQGPHILSVSNSGSTAEVKFEAIPGSMPVLDGAPKKSGVQLVTVSSLGGHALIQFSFTPAKVTLDNQPYDWKVDGVDVPTLSAGSHTLTWQQSGTTATQQFETGPGPQLIVFASQTNTTLGKTNVPQPPKPPEPPPNPHAKEIDALLHQAQNAMGQQHYVEPAGDNAIELANKVLQLDSSNEYALSYREYSIKRMQDWIENDLKANTKVTTAEAQRLLGLLSSLVPDDQRIPKLQAEVEAAERAEQPAPKRIAAPKPVFTAKLTYAAKAGKSRGTLVVIGQHLEFKSDDGAGPSLNIPCSTVDEFRSKGRVLGIGQKGFRVVTRSGETYEFLSDRVTAEDLLSACSKK